MFNSDTPSRAELPTAAQLLRSTVIAIVTAGVLLVTVVLPAEYGIDPTGIGRALQLTEMGTIKHKLAAEAKIDGAKNQKSAPEPVAGISSAAPAKAAPTPAPAPNARADEMSLVLKPDQGAEIKMQMRKGAQASYSWTITGGVVNFDEHGDGSEESTISYEKGKGAAKKEGTLEAAFDGIHGWYWRNRGNADVTVNLRTNGDYSAIQRME